METSQIITILLTSVGVIALWLSQFHLKNIRQDNKEVVSKVNQHSERITKLEVRMDGVEKENDVMHESKRDIYTTLNKIEKNCAAQNNGGNK